MSALRAHFDGENFVPDEPVGLPKGTPVTVRVASGNGRSPLQDLLDLADQFPIVGAPDDGSQQHGRSPRPTFWRKQG